MLPNKKGVEALCPPGHGDLFFFFLMGTCWMLVNLSRLGVPSVNMIFNYIYIHTDRQTYRHTGIHTYIHNHT